MTPPSFTIPCSCRMAERPDAIFLAVAPRRWTSIQRILALPANTRLFTGHDYMPGGREPRWESTVAQQNAHNIHLLKARTEAEFVSLREARDRTEEVPICALKRRSAAQVCRFATERPSGARLVAEVVEWTLADKEVTIGRSSRQPLPCAECTGATLIIPEPQDALRSNACVLALFADRSSCLRRLRQA